MDRRFLMYYSAIDRAVLCAQASLSRPESALGLQDLFSPTAAQQAQNLSMFSAPPHPPPIAAGFDLESPRGSFGPAHQTDPLASPHFHYGNGSSNLQVQQRPPNSNALYFISFFSFPCHVLHVCRCSLS